MSSSSWLREALRYNGVFWRRFAYLGCVYAPEWWKSWSPGPIGSIVFALIEPNRRAATANMKRILGIDDERVAATVARRMFGEFAHCFAESMEFYSPRARPIEFDAPPRDSLMEALRAGRGAVVVSAHLGNWDVAAKAMRNYGRPMNIVMAHEVNETTHEFVRAAREAAGVRVIYSDSSVFSSINMVRALRNNEIVAIQIDRADRAVDTRRVPFFGKPASFPSGPFVLARVSGAPIIPVFIPRLGRRRYAVRVGEPIVVPREARGSGALERAMGDVVGALEAIVREFPTQWFQFTPFWPGDEPRSGASIDGLDEKRRQLRGRA